jgi:hypothetical protein
MGGGEAVGWEREDGGAGVKEVGWESLSWSLLVEEQVTKARA